jgi:hypothetical protein
MSEQKRMSKDNPKELTHMHGAASPRPDVPLFVRVLESFPHEFDVAIEVDGKLYHACIKRVMRDSEFSIHMGTIVLEPRGER